MDRENVIIETYGIDISGHPPYVFKAHRWDALFDLYRKLDLRVGVEIGVENGKYSEALLSHLPDITLYSIDCWEVYDNYREGWQEKTEANYQATLQRLARFGDRSVVIKEFAQNTLSMFDDNSLDYVFIDGNHEFRAVVDDIDDWSRKMKVGGLITGHDYTMRVRDYEVIEVQAAVDAWTYAKNINPWFVAKGKTKYPVWMWVKHE